MIELLSPVGDFNSLKAAVQNGADSVYFGSNTFSARAFAHNFDLAELEKAISYAKIRGVKTNLTLNTLIKDTEFVQAISLAKYAYRFGIDAIIVQDLGLAMELMRLFPSLPIHASTQMTVYDLNGALELEKLGFKRVVLARELSINEIDYICKNTKIEIECFAHGALCISYSGQCLFSSILGGRSGNRGKCAGPCRLPYKLFENNKEINSGYLLSTRDLYSLDYIPDFIKSGVKCLKIEGRMKSAEYVATVTHIYRKYIDLALSQEPYIVDPKDKEALMQIFNRGMSSSGHLDSNPNRNFVFKEKPNNMGLFLGKVQKYNKAKGLITVKLREPIAIGDTVSLEHESGAYTISELMDNKSNIKETAKGQTVTIGRMKGNINANDKIFKMSSKALSTEAKNSYKGEHRKIALNCKVTIKKNRPISIEISSGNNLLLYKNLHLRYEIDESPLEAKNRPLSKEDVIKQISKTTSSMYEFKNINVDLDDNCFLPKISSLNELRRVALEQVENFAISKCARRLPKISINANKCTINKKVLHLMRKNVNSNTALINANIPKVSVLLNELNLAFDYSKLVGATNIYIPLKYFSDKKYEETIKTLSKKIDIYIYMPTVIKGNYKNIFINATKKSIQTFDITGFVISNIGNIKLLSDIFADIGKYFKVVANYTFNIFNNHTVLELKKLGISSFTLSPELDKDSMHHLCNYKYLSKELIVYGRIPLVNMNYCLLGESNKCYPECKAKCQSNNHYYLQDRLNMQFPIKTDNIQSVTTIYNSKITSISYKEFPVDSIRIDALDETIEQLNHIINLASSGKRLQGSSYTSANLNKQI